MKPWTEDDSRALDAEVRALRAADRRERAGTPAPVTQSEARGHGRRRARTDEDVKRRKKVARAMQVRAEREANRAARSETYKANRSKRPGRDRWPRPKQKPNGRWLAEITDAGQFYSKTFDTEPEAQEWLDSITGGEPNGAT